MFQNKSILITGGTGSLGKALTAHILNKHPEIERVVIYSRDEQKQFQMSQQFPKKKFPKMQLCIGDVRDKERLQHALYGIDYVIHTAAMKHLDIVEYNPGECIKTNIGGSSNLIEACLNSDVSKVIALSTDKACAPISLYGATKLAADKLFVAANNMTKKKDVHFSVVRYGNVMGSNGSVVPLFLDKKHTGVLPITDPRMTRFNISLTDGIKMILHALHHAWGGEIFVPKIPSYKITDVAKAIAPNCNTEIIGMRPNEKIHEEMITVSDAFYTYDLGSYYTILPSTSKWQLKDYIKEFNAEKVPQGFMYNSEKNNQWETVESLRILIKKHVDAAFTL